MSDNTIRIIVRNTQPTTKEVTEWYFTYSASPTEPDWYASMHEGHGVYFESLSEIVSSPDIPRVFRRGLVDTLRESGILSQLGKLALESHYGK